MYCPKCQTEYRKGFATCADCDIPLLEGLPPEADRRVSLGPGMRLFHQFIDFIRTNDIPKWSFAVIIGIIFYYVFSYTRYFFYLIGFLNLLTSILSNLNSAAVTIVFNIIFTLTSGLVASLLCGSLFIYVLQKTRVIYSIVAGVSFFVVNIILKRGSGRFWKAPDLVMQMSALMTAVLAALIFIITVRLLMRAFKKKTVN